VPDFSISFLNRSSINFDSNRLVETARFVMQELNLHPFTKVSIQCVTLDEMEMLHVEHMDEPGATDVLSFPMDELRVPAEGEAAVAGDLGEIILCPEFAQNQAKENGQSFENEFDLLLTHGILHLLGHDHYEPEEHREMFTLQADILSKLSESRGSN
jgi:probable rRNA maturation factor